MLVGLSAIRLIIRIKLIRVCSRGNSVSVSWVAVSLGDLASRFMLCQKLFRSGLSGGGKGSTEAGNRGRARFTLWRNGCPLAQESFSAPVLTRAHDFNYLWPKDRLDKLLCATGWRHLKLSSIVRHRSA